MRFDGLVHSPFTISEGVEVDLLIVQGDGIGPEITSATLTAVSALQNEK